MLWTQVAHVTITVHNADPIDADTWSAYVRWCAEHKTALEAGRANDLRSLIYSAGGAPSAKQRELYTKAVGEAHIPVAICSSSPVMRAIGTAISWFTKQRFAFFSMNELDEALDYLELHQPEQRQEIRETVHRLLAEVNRCA